MPVPIKTIMLAKIMYGPAGVDVFPTSGVIGVIPFGKFSGGSEGNVSKLSIVITIPKTSVAAAPIEMYLVFICTHIVL